MTTARVVKASFTVNENSPIQDYVHLDDHAAIMLYLLIMKLRLTPLFKPFTIHNILFTGEKTKKESQYTSSYITYLIVR